jgi:transposase
MKSIANKNLKEKKENRIKELRLKNEEREALFIGVDMHSDSFSVTVVDSLYNIRKRANIPAKSTSLLHLIRGLGNCDVKVCYEAGGFGYWLHDDLAMEDIDVMVIAPSKMYKRPGERVKTDRRDSVELAIQLAKGMLTEVTVPDKTRRAHRQIIRLYDQVKKERQRMMIRIKAFLRLYGKNAPKGVGNWTRKYVDWLKGLEFEGDANESLAYTLDLYIEQYKFLCERERDVKKKLAELRELSKYKERLRVLKGIKGVGDLTAQRIVFEVGNCSRFKNSRKFTSYLGLTPSENSSGGKVRRGPITGNGNLDLRSSLVEAAWMVIRYDDSLRDTFKRLSFRRGSTRAIVAVARKLAIRLYWKLIEVEMMEQAA